MSLVGSGVQYGLTTKAVLKVLIVKDERRNISFVFDHLARLRNRILYLIEYLSRAIWKSSSSLFQLVDCLEKV